MTTPQEMCRIQPESLIMGFGIYQSWSAMYVMNKLLNEHLDIKRIVELGTCSGGFAVFLGSIMKNRGGKTLTFDIADPNPIALDIYPTIDVEFIKQDVFLDESREMVRDFIKDERALVFCDGGLKKREFEIYTDVVKPGDLFMAHDWLTEIFKEDLTDRTLSQCEFYRQQEMDAMGTMILSMIKCADSSPERVARNKSIMYG